MLIAIGFIAIGAFAQGNLKQSAYLGIAAPCNYDIYFLTDSFLGGGVTQTFYYNQTAVPSPATNYIYNPLPGEYIVEFGVRPNSGGAWTVVALFPSSTGSTGVSLNSNCGGPFQQVGYDQTGPTYLYIALHD